MTTDLLAELRAKRQADYLKTWKERLGFCNECGHEYIAAEAIMFKEEKCCPQCVCPENVTYYYCNKHGAGQCEECL